jgi:CcmD family protein
MKNKLLAFFIAGIFLPLISSAQEIEMADTFRGNGKIYVVITVMGIILAGIFIYLFMLGNKVSRLEKKLGGKK